LEELQQEVVDSAERKKNNSQRKYLKLVMQISLPCLTRVCGRW
jgi:hypothetical protein